MAAMLHGGGGYAKSAANIFGHMIRGGEPTDHVEDTETATTLIDGGICITFSVGNEDLIKGKKERELRRAAKRLEKQKPDFNVGEEEQKVREPL